MKTDLKHVYSNMHQRCENPNNPRYKDWGGRGIKVCKRWSGKLGKKHFFEDIERILGERPKNCTLDRINNDGDYKPSNMKWSTYSEQNYNRRKLPNKTGENNISLIKNKYRVFLYENAKTRHIGYYRTIKEAKKARDEALKTRGFLL